ncbi:hypothetical protein C9J48_23090 [Photobacterium profundum]|uniref:transposase n=1 Tax=Photobacterium profundum TaxID=74109 RepID=UPI0009D6E929|nr:hypothetical protein C9J48_23090 [Photobacterium profundum]
MVYNLPNVSIIKLPPYSPERNSIEQVWSWMSQHHLTNQAFEIIMRLLIRFAMLGIAFLSDMKRVTRVRTRNWISLTS